MRTDRKIISRAVALLLTALSLLGLCACGGEKTKASGVFRVTVLEPLESTNPFTAEGALADELFLLVYDPLWRYDENYDPVPCLAESWDVSTDKLTWTIRLQKGVLFSDGVELTSADVAFSYELMRRYSDKYAQYLQDIESIVCPDDYTVVITTSSIRGDMLYNPTPILPKHLWSSYSDKPGNYENAELVGTGPFVYRADASGNGVWTLDANVDYFGGSPQIAQLIFQYEQSAATAAAALTTGEADACMGLTDAQLTTLQEVRGIDLVKSQTPNGSICILGMNTQINGLDDPVVRQAIEYCVDRERIFAMAFGGNGVQGSVIFAPGDDFYQPAQDLREYSLEKVAALLESRGFRDSDGDGVRETEDGSVELSFTIYTGADDEWAATALTFLQDDLGDVGIKLTWKTLDEGEDLYDTCNLGGKWGMFLDTLTCDVNPVVTASLFYSGNKNVTGWADETYDSLYDQLRKTSVQADRITLCRSIQEKIYDECPCIVLAYPVSIQAIRSDLWTGYQDVLEKTGGLFGTGAYLTYMTVTQNTENEVKG